MLLKGMCPGISFNGLHTALALSQVEASSVKATELRAQVGALSTAVAAVLFSTLRLITWS